MWETWVRSLGCKDPMEEGMATHSSILTWRIHHSPWGPKESDKTEWLSLSLFHTSLVHESTDAESLRICIWHQCKYDSHTGLLLFCPRDSSHSSLGQSCIKNIFFLFYLVSFVCFCFLFFEVKRKSSVMSDSLRPHGLHNPWNLPGQNTGVGSCSLLQGVFLIQGSNPGLPHYRWILYQLHCIRFSVLFHRWVSS